jgi:signal transduction histidine kinase
MLVDAKGDILIGTDSGLNRVHDGRIVPDPEFSALAKEKIWAIYQDPGGPLWLGTRGGGLLRLHAGKVSRFTTISGLPSNTVYQILVDVNGKFWMSTSSGIFSADPREFDRGADSRKQLINLTSYGTADGMRTSQMNGGFQPAGARAVSGDLWFPSVKGAARINPATIPRRRTPPMFIEKLIADGISIPLSGEVGVPPGRRHLEIDFTLCDLVAPQRASFQYKLEGFDESWNPAFQRSVSYTNLRPGHYRFRVRAQDSSSRPDVSEAALSFTLEPQFYQADWFYGVAVLACAALIWAGMRFYARQMRVRYALVLNERMAERGRVAREMHDTIVQGCVGVSTLLEAVDRFSRVNAAEAGRLLDDARTQINVTLEEARQAIWDLRYASAEQTSVTMLFDLARKLGAEHHLQVETDVSGDGGLDPETDRTLLLVGREALRNAVAHARPSRIQIRITLRDSEALLDVIDDGVGFVVADGPDAQNKHFGMIGMRERIEKSGGSILIESAPGKGTRIATRVPLARHDDGRMAVRFPFVKSR